MRRPVDLAGEEERLDEVLEAADQQHPPVDRGVQVESSRTPVTGLSLTWLTSHRPGVGGETLREVVPVPLVPVRVARRGPGAEVSSHRTVSPRVS